MGYVLSCFLNDFTFSFIGLPFVVVVITMVISLEEYGSKEV